MFLNDIKQLVSWIKIQNMLCLRQVWSYFIFCKQVSIWNQVLKIATLNTKGVHIHVPSDSDPALLECTKFCCKQIKSFITVSIEQFFFFIFSRKIPDQEIKCYFYRLLFSQCENIKSFIISYTELSFVLHVYQLLNSLKKGESIEYELHVNTLKSLVEN